MADVHRTHDEPLKATKSRTLGNGLPSSAHEGTQMWGRYLLLETCGEGSCGTVYHAWDPELEREIAIKILHEHRVDVSRKERLLREGRALAQIQHPNVVRVLGVEAFEGHIGLCMEFVRGETLEALLAAHGRWNARETLIVGKDVCAALAAVHRAGLLHRDVKARNVMRDPTGRVVLMDFGTGRTANPIMLALNVAGTPLYMAPEVLAGEPASVSSDVYSVGVLLYHLLTAADPFEGQTTEELREAHRLGPQQRLVARRPDLPVAIIRVVERALAVSVEERYATADALFDALDAAVGEPKVDHVSDAEHPRAKSLVVMPTQVFGESPDD